MNKSKESKTLTPGQVMVAHLSKIGESAPTPATLEVAGFLGKGFSSAVWKARMNGDTEVVIKVLDPGGKRKIFRDAFSNVMFGLPYPGAYFEPALLIAEGQRDLLQRGLEIEAKTHKGLRTMRFAQSYGHFKVPEVGKFADVVEFIEGNPLRPLVPGSEAEGEFWSKKHHLDDMVNIAERMGMSDLARQWKASTLVATLNAFSVGFGNDRQTVIHDWRPGLGIIVPLPLSPGDIVGAAKLAASGRAFSFDRIDFKKLDKYVNEHPDSFEDLKPVIDQLKQAQSLCEKVFISPLTINPKRFLDPQVRSLRRHVVAEAYYSDRLIGTENKSSIENSDLSAALHWGINSLPVVGPEIQKTIFDHDRHVHLVRLLTDSSYRHQLNQEALQAMVEEGRVSPGAAGELASTDLGITVERVLSILPPKLHRLSGEKDIHDLYVWAGRKIVEAGKVLVQKEANQKWISGQIDQGQAEGDITPEVAMQLKEKAADKKTISLTRDLTITTAGADFAGKLLVQPALIAAGGYFDSGTLLLMGTTGMGVGSIMRGGYFSFKAIANLAADIANKRETRFWADMGVALLGAAPVGGNIAALVRMRVWEKELADFLAMRAIDKIASKIPVLGGRGTLTEALIHKMYDKLANKKAPDPKVEAGPELMAAVLSPQLHMQ